MVGSQIFKCGRLPLSSMGSWTKHYWLSESWREEEGLTSSGQVVSCISAIISFTFYPARTAELKEHVTNEIPARLFVLATTEKMCIFSRHLRLYFVVSQAG